jgi:hypothetical protein
MLSQVQWGELTIHLSYHNDGVGVKLLAQLPLCGRTWRQDPIEQPEHNSD